VSEGKSQTTRWTLAGRFAVAGTGKRGAYKNWLRAPRHASVKRALLSVMDTLRGVTVPPNDWDDIPRQHDRSWKRHRRTRWLETAQ
jgi:hypothetical protein